MKNNLKTAHEWPMHKLMVDDLDNNCTLEFVEWGVGRSINREILCIKLL